MYPELLRFSTPEFLRFILPSELVLHSYGFVIMLGVVVIYFFMEPRIRKFNLTGEDLSNIIFYSFIAAFVGGKLFYYLQSPMKYFNKPSLLMENIGSGFVFYGSLLFVIPTLYILLKKKNIEIRSFLDLMAFVGPIMHSFGRLGCLLAGCCYGLPWDSPLGLVFNHPLTKARPLGTSLYPTQLMDIGVNLIIILVLYLVNKRKSFQGQLFLIYIALYGVGRSIVEVFRGDSARGFFFDLISHSQMIALVLIITCLVLWKNWSRDPKL